VSVRIRRCACVLVLTAGTACAPSRGAAFDHAFAEGARAESAGRLAEAVEDYDRAATLAVRARDREQAQWNAVDALVRARDFERALSRLDVIARDPSGEHAAEAAYRAAALRIERGGGADDAEAEAKRGWRDMELVPRRFPQHGVAHVAVRRLVDHADEGGTRAGLDELRLLERDLAGTELAPLVAFATAEHVEALGDASAARDAYLRIADRWPYPFGGFFDDSLWRASLLDEKLGRFESAIDDLERMVSVRETTILIGTYERPKYVPAMLRIGALWRDRLHDRARARAAFHRLYTDFAHSTARDDALWQEAALWREDGDTHTACDRLALLVREFPDSRYVPCAAQLCSELALSARPHGSTRADHAEKACHPYITRTDEPQAQDAGSEAAPNER
jgi:outer membrane protein assembly factor BamD (BamD/ComL family)